jgi:hypothetical protein
MSAAIPRYSLSLIWLLLAASLFSCRVNRTRHTPIFTAGSYCYVAPPAAAYFDSLWTERLNQDTTFSTAVRHRFSQRARSVAADIGVQAVLSEWLQTRERLKKTHSESDQIRMLSLRQEISDRILLATQELTSVLAEIECERARANELKNYLQQQMDRRVTRLTVYSVLAGALSTVVSGTLAILGADDVYIETPAMAGAVLSGYWAIRALGGYEEAEFLHRRNYLTDIQENPTISKVYPPMVWHFLTREFEPDKQTQTVRETILERWSELDLLDGEGTEEREQNNRLLFGSGGMYTLEGVNLRISLIEALQNEIIIMNQELKQLQQELILER